MEDDVKAIAPARPRLGCGERDPHALRPPIAREAEQSAPAAAKIEQPLAFADADLLRDVKVLATLRLLEAEREVAVELRAAEVRELAKAQPDDPVNRGVRELKIFPLRDEMALRFLGGRRAPRLAPLSTVRGCWPSSHDKLRYGRSAILRPQIKFERSDLAQGSPYGLHRRARYLAPAFVFLGLA